MGETLLIMARSPVLGAVKSRIAATEGESAALGVYSRLAALTSNAAHSLRMMRGTEPVVMLDGPVDPARGVFGTSMRFVAQSDGDLGARLLAAFAAAFLGGSSRCIAIGTDCPDLDAERLDRAFDALDTTDSVLGPAVDGGYYLIGATREAWQRLNDRLFADIPWGTAAVAEHTRDRLEEREASVTELETLRDIDDVADLRAWVSECRGECE